MTFNNFHIFLFDTSEVKITTMNRYSKEILIKKDRIFYTQNINTYVLLLTVISPYLTKPSPQYDKDHECCFWNFYILQLMMLYMSVVETIIPAFDNIKILTISPDTLLIIASKASSVSLWTRTYSIYPLLCGIIHFLLCSLSSFTEGIDIQAI